MKDPKELLDTTIKEILSHLESDATYIIKQDQDSYLVDVNSNNPSRLIGFHGKGLEALNLMLKMIVYNKTEKWLAIEVDVNNYYQNKKETLDQMAQKLVQRVKFSGKPQIVGNLSSAERKIIHTILSDHPDVTTSSIGEKSERKLVVNLKSD